MSKNEHGTPARAMERERRKLLIAAVAVVLVSVTLAAVLQPGTEAANPEGYDEITPEQFLALDTDNDGVIDLGQNYYITGSVKVTKNLTINTNGHNLTTGGDMFRMYDPDQLTPSSEEEDVGSLTINGKGSILTAGSTGLSSVAFSRYTNADLTINGGTFVSDEPIVWGCGGPVSEVTASVSISDATIRGGEAGVWLSYYQITNASITGCTISGGVGVYLGTVQDATISDCKISGVDSGVEVKAGNVTINSCTISSESYLADPSVGMSQSGGSAAGLTVNNGYCGSANVSAVNVTIDAATKISTSSDAEGATPIVVTSYYEETNEDGSTTIKKDDSDISISWADHSVSDATFNFTKSLADFKFNGSYAVGSQDSFYRATGVAGTVEVVKDFKTDKLLYIRDSVTINGNGHTIGTTQNGADNATIRIASSTDVADDAIGSGKTVVLNDLVVEGPTPVNYTRGITVHNTQNLTLEINGCRITAGSYAINIGGGNTGLNISVNDSEISGWAAFQTHSMNTTATFTDSTLIGTNIQQNPESNGFSTIVINSTASQASEASGSFTFERCTIKAVEKNKAGQQAIDIRSMQNSSMVLKDCVIDVSETKNKIAALSVTTNTLEIQEKLDIIGDYGLFVTTVLKFGTGATLASGTLAVSCGAAVTGDFTLESGATMGLQDGSTYTGVVTGPDGSTANANGITPTEGNLVTITGGSIIIDGTADSGDMTVTGDVVVRGTNGGANFKFDENATVVFDGFEQGTGDVTFQTTEGEKSAADMIKEGLGDIRLSGGTQLTGLPFTVTGARTYTYDGNMHNPSVSLPFTAVDGYAIPASSITGGNCVNESGTAIKAQKDVGEYYVDYKLLVTDELGEEVGWYKVTYSWSIVPADVLIAVDEIVKEYDGKDTVTQTIKVSQDPNITFGNLVYTDANAGDEKEVRLPVILSNGSVPDNYAIYINGDAAEVLGDAEGGYYILLSGSITKKNLTITVDVEKTYDGTALEHTLTSDDVTGLVDGDSVNGGTITTTGSNVKDYITEASDWAIDGLSTVNGISNYNVIYNTISLEITKAPLTVTVDADKAYDGAKFAYNIQATDVDGLASNDSLTAGTITTAGSDVNDYVTQISDWTVTNALATANGIGNYNVTYNVSLEITKAPLTITGATISEKTYDGTTEATVTAVTFDGLVGEETLILSTDFTAAGVFDNENAGSGKTVTVTVTLNETDVTKNYALGQTTYELTGQTIAKATLSINAVAVESTKVFDGTTDSTVTAVTFSGLIGAETLNLGTDFTAVGTYDDANAGSGKTVTVAVTLGETDVASNYTLSSTTSTTTAAITARPIVADDIGYTLAESGSVITLTVTVSAKVGESTISPTAFSSTLTLNGENVAGSTNIYTITSGGSYTVKVSASTDNNWSGTNVEKTFSISLYSVQFLSKTAIDGNYAVEQSVSNQASVMLPTVKNVPEGYRFVGWTVGESGEDTLPAGTYYNASVGASDLYAKYERTAAPEPSADIGAIGAGFFEDAETAKQYLRTLGSTYDGEVDANTMFLVYRQSGMSSETMTGELYYGTEQVFTEGLNDADGVRSWLFSWENQLKGKVLSDGLYRIDIKAGDTVVLTAFVEVRLTAVPADAKLTFEVGDYGTLKETSMTVKVDDHVVLPAPIVSDGYAFLGWTVGQSTVINGQYHVTGDTTFTAVYDKVAVDTHQVTFSGGGVVFYVDNQYRYTAGTYAIAAGEHTLDVVVLAGYEGTPVVTGVDGGKFTVSGETTIFVSGVTPVSEPVTYKVTFTVNDISTAVTVNAGDSVFLYVPVKDGYEFAGWKVGTTDDVLQSGYYMPTDDVTLTAQFSQETVETAEVTYKAEGLDADAIVTLPKNDDVVVGTVVNLSALSVEGYTFDGWYVNGMPAGAQYIVTEDVQFVAKFVKVLVPVVDPEIALQLPMSFTAGEEGVFMLHVNRGTADATVTGSITVAGTSAYTLEYLDGTEWTPVSGGSFGGAGFALADGTVIFKIVFEESGNFPITAKLTDGSELVIEDTATAIVLGGQVTGQYFVKFGETGSITGLSIGETVTAPLITPEEGFRLIGWQTENGVLITGQQYTVYAADDADGDMTIALEPVFEKYIFTITVSCEGNGSATTPIKVEKNGTAVIVPAPEAGYEVSSITATGDYTVVPVGSMYLIYNVGSDITVSVVFSEISGSADITMTAGLTEGGVVVNMSSNDGGVLPDGDIVVTYYYQEFDESLGFEVSKFQEVSMKYDGGFHQQTQQTVAVTFPSNSKYGYAKFVVNEEVRTQTAYFSTEVTS